MRLPGRDEQLLEIMELHLALFDCNYLEDYYEGGFRRNSGGILTVSRVARRHLLRR